MHCPPESLTHLHLMTCFVRISSSLSPSKKSEEVSFFEETGQPCLCSSGKMFYTLAQLFNNLYKNISAKPPATPWREFKWDFGTRQGNPVISFPCEICFLQELFYFVFIKCIIFSDRRFPEYCTRFSDFCTIFQIA